MKKRDLDTLEARDGDLFCDVWKKLGLNDY